MFSKLVSRATSFIESLDEKVGETAILNSIEDDDQTANSSSDLQQERLKLQRMQAEADEAENITNNLEKERFDLEQELDSIKENIRRRDMEIASLEDKVKAKEADARSRARVMEAQREELGKAISAGKKEVEETQLIIDRKNSELSSKREAVSKLEESLNALNQERKKIASENALAQPELSELDEMQREYDNESAESARMRSQYMREQTVSREIKEKLISDIQEAKSRNKRLETDLFKAKTKLEATEHELEFVSKQINDTKLADKKRLDKLIEEENMHFNSELRKISQRKPVTNQQEEEELVKELEYLNQRKSQLMIELQNNEMMEKIPNSENSKFIPITAIFPKGLLPYVYYPLTKMEKYLIQKYRHPYAKIILAVLLLIVLLI